MIEYFDNWRHICKTPRFSSEFRHNMSPNRSKRTYIQDFDNGIVYFNTPRSTYNFKRFDLEKINDILSMDFLCILFPRILHVSPCSIRDPFSGESAEISPEKKINRMTGSGETAHRGAEGERKSSQAKGPGHDDTLKSTLCVHRRSNCIPCGNLSGQSMEAQTLSRGLCDSFYFFRRQI